MRTPLPGEFAQINRDNQQMVVQILKPRIHTYSPWIELQPYQEDGWKREQELHMSEDEFKRLLLGVQIGNPRISYTGTAKIKEITMEDSDGFAYTITIFEEL